MLVTEAIERANRSLDYLFQALEGIDPQEMALPNTIGLWSIKDVLNHLIVWEEEAAQAFEIWKVGIEPDWSHIVDLDKFNNETVGKRRGIPLSKIKNQLNLIHHGIIENLKSVPEDEFGKRGGIPKWLITLLTVHIDGHSERIRQYKEALQTA